MKNEKIVSKTGNAKKLIHLVAVASFITLVASCNTAMRMRKKRAWA
jgi:predicted small secreted protein